jgi:hypothetical protein
MQLSPDASIPGSRIDGYRNSQPRSVRLYGLGEQGSKIVQNIGSHSGSNVAVRSGKRRAGWQEIAGAPADSGTNMVVIVCGEGDQILFDGDDNKPDSLVTFVLVQKVANALVVTDEKFSRARNHCDLFVTTSDTDYVSDLIGNLAS